MQRYKLYILCDTNISNGYWIYHWNDKLVDIEIKQNKEDMEEKNWTLDDAIKHYDEIGKSSISQECSKKNHQVRDWLVELKQYKNLSNSEKIGEFLKPFDLEAAKSGKPVCTRDGRKARIICFDRNSNKPIVALITTNDREYLTEYYCDGRISHNSSESNDLMMLPEKKEGWINVAKEPLGEDAVALGYIYQSYEDAVKAGTDNDRYIATVKISWEE